MPPLILLFIFIAIPGQEDLPVIEAGDIVKGVIEDGDSVVHTENLDERYTQAPTLGRQYTLRVGLPGFYTLEMKSLFFDTYLVLRDPKGTILAEDDDGFYGTHSRIVFKADPGRGICRLDACALHGRRGGYEIRLIEGRPASLRPHEKTALETNDARERIRIVEELEGEDSLELISCLDDLIRLLGSQGRWLEAEPVIKKYCAICEKVQGPKHLDTAAAWNNYAAVLCMQGKLEEGLTFYDKAYRITRKALGPDHPRTAMSLNNLARTHLDLGNLDTAKPLFKEAIGIWERAVGPDEAFIAAGFDNLARLHQARGDAEEARILYEKALQINEKVRGPEHPDTAMSLASLAEFLRSQGHLEEAQSLHERALRIREKALGPENINTTMSLLSLAKLFLEQGNILKAKPLFKRALPNWEKAAASPQPHFAYTFNKMARYLEDNGLLEEARPLFERALQIREEALGPDHPDTAMSLNNLGMLLHKMGNSDGARPLVERALRICEKVLGSDHPNTAMSMDNLATVIHALGKYEQSRSLCERALRIRENALGPEHPLTAASLNNLASLLKDRGEMEKARNLYERALHIYEKASGPEHPDTADCLFNLAKLLQDQMEYEEALRLYQKVIGIRSKAFGPDHPETADSMNNLAHLHYTQWNIEEARPLFEKVLEIRKKVLGPEHPDTALSLNNMALLFQTRGELEAARPLLERALEIREKVLGPEHPDTAMSLNSLSTLLYYQGNLEEARLLCERALSIQEKILGMEHRDVAPTLNSLALLLYTQNDFEEAKALLERAHRIGEKTLGPGHPQTALIMSNLASAYSMGGYYDEARSLLRQALRVQQSVLGRDHPDTATSLSYLAGLHAVQGEYDKAESLYKEALRIREKVLGLTHYHTLSNYNSLAKVLYNLGRFNEAFELSRRALVSSDIQHKSLLWSLSEYERLLYAAIHRRTLEIFLSLSRRASSIDNLEQAYATLLQWKGRVSRTLLQTRDWLFSRLEPECRDLLTELERTQSQLSAALFARNIIDPKAHEAHIGRLRIKRSELEATLSRRSGHEPDEGEISLPRILAALPDDSAVVDFFIHRWYSPEELAKSGSSAKRLWTDPHLSAWILKKVDETPYHQDLGPAHLIQNVAQEFLSQRIGPGPLRGEIRKREKAMRTPDVMKAGRTLRSKLWDPLAVHLEGVKCIFISPDSFLGTLPFEVLQLDDETFLIEHFSFVYLRDVASLARILEQAGDRGKHETSGLLMVGAVDYSNRKSSIAKESREAPAAVKSWGPPPSSLPLYRSSDSPWEGLPGTEEEAQVILELYKTSIREGRSLFLQGPAATEERVKDELPDYSTIHLATHGFFQPESLPSLWDQAREESGRDRMEMFPEARRLTGILPGFLSGLVLAGAGDPYGEGREDGFLTAEELSWLDLSGVDLVVLSACETGLGSPEGGEGMIGLRRSLRQAGAKTVISSLWSVEDESTRALMQNFYRRLWLLKESKLEALRNAQLDLLKKNRREHGRGLPSTWGAFVLDGDWR